ncbi:rhombosortase [Aliikangiella sp. IMCC44359]|uniref:rhombosortase n=1 Tax=Aliikangiella sp. IMCC44359 TaxID=3459125 RepID=UPI00403B135C
MSTKNHIKPFYLVIFIILISLFIQVFAPESLEFFRYQSTEVSNGEWWRLISANFTHSNWNHWVLNMLGLLLMDFLFQPLISFKLRACLLTFCIVINVVLIHMYLTIHWYVGLSGALHGYLFGGALLSINKAKTFAFLILIIVSIKLFVELNWEINQTTASFINANVVEEAHLFGTISSIIFCIFYWLSHKIRKVIV